MSIVSWQWDLDGVIISTDQICSATPDVGVHTMILTVGDTSGTSATKTYDFEVYSSAREITDWEWDFGNNNSATTQSATIDYDQAGYYSISLTVTDVSGSDTIIIPYMIKVIGDQVNFHWDFGDGGIGTGREIEHIYNQRGNFLVTLTVSDFWGRETSATANIYIDLAGKSTIMMLF